MVTSSSPAQSQSRQRGGAANQARRQGRVHALSLAYAYDQKHYLDDESLAISSEAASLADGAVELGENFTACAKSAPPLMPSSINALPTGLWAAWRCSTAVFCASVVMN